MELECVVVIDNGIPIRTPSIFLDGTKYKRCKCYLDAYSILVEQYQGGTYCGLYLAVKDASIPDPVLLARMDYKIYHTDNGLVIQDLKG